MGAGVLHARTAAARFTLDRYPPSPGLSAFVDFYWTVRWDLRGQPPHEQAILPHATVNLAFETTGASVHGVDRKIFTRRLAGEGRALGVRFRPGGFRPFYGKSVAALNDRVIPARDIFGPAADEACAVAMADGASDEAMMAAAEKLLFGCRVAADPLAERVAGIVERITADPGLRRVAALTEVAGMPERRLQRLFADYVGVSPKWVMRRARLHEAALHAESGADVDWATLACDLATRTRRTWCATSPRPSACPRPGTPAAGRGPPSPVWLRQPYGHGRMVAATIRLGAGRTASTRD